MRTFIGRVIHSLLFELVLLVVATPILALVLNKSMSHTGMMSLVLSITAMICNGFYNYAFDKILLSFNRPLYPRSFYFRCVHSILFELCLLTITLPILMWWMGFSFLQALALDISFSIFVPIYALIFNWIYDGVSPPPGFDGNKPSSEIFCPDRD